MSFPRYPKYKDSGVEWLGEVPEHWEVRRIGTLFRQASAPGTDDLPILSVSIHDGVSDKELPEEELDRKVTRSDDRTKYKAVRPGDLVYNMMRAWQGGFGTVTVEGMVSPAYVVARPTADFDTTFIERLLRTPAAIENMRRCSYGVTDFRLRLYWEAFKSIEVAVPPRSEQACIAALLDHETSKIDALIAEQQRLIELLQEKRQAVISNAVTKGLNPVAPMKDSGIEWLGKVPEHWQVVRLRYLCDIQTGSRDTENAVDDGAYPFFVRSETVERINTCAANCEAVFTAGDGAGVGKVFHHYQGPFDFHQRVYMMNNFRQVTGRFLYHYLRANFYKVALEGTAKSTVDSLRRPMFTGFSVAVPPLKEQENLVATIESNASDFDSLVAEAERAITLLQDRRSALISAAVTGQIDVRGLAGSEAA